MSKVAHYLQEHLLGEVMTSPDARRYFATDTSIFNLAPAIIVYPRNENDVRKATRFTWQLAERGRVIPITARGSGTDQTGAALGSGVMMVFPAHMNKILELDVKTGVVTVQPGLNYGKLQQTLHTHGRFMPPYPSSLEYSTIGGAIANNASGDKTVKYGDTRKFVKSLRVVLANGEVIETSRLNKRDLNKKLGLNSFEGDIYRGLDKILEDNHKLIKDFKLATTKNSAGYELNEIRNKDDSFDLTPLLVGSQGTLGIISEAVLSTENYNPETSLILVGFDELSDAQNAILELRKLPDMPSSIEMVDDNLLNFVDKVNPNQIKDLLDRPFKKIYLFIEFDNSSSRNQKRMIKKCRKLLSNYKASIEVEYDDERQQEMWKIRHSAATVIGYGDGNARALPIIEDGIVPPEKMKEFLEAVYAIFEHHLLQAAVWGHAGDGNLHMQPFLDLAQLGGRQKIFRLMDDYYALVIRLGGSISGEHGDGRLRGPYLKQFVGEEMYGVYEQIKTLFDPHGTLNPGVKIGVSSDAVKPLLRQTYSLEHFYDHMPRS